MSATRKRFTPSIGFSECATPIEIYLGLPHAIRNRGFASYGDVIARPSREEYDEVATQTVIQKKKPVCLATTDVELLDRQDDRLEHVHVGIQARHG